MKRLLLILFLCGGVFPFEIFSQTLFDTKLDSEIVIVYDDSAKEIQASKALVEELLQEFSQDQNLVGKVKIRLIPYSLQNQRPNPSLKDLRSMDFSTALSRAQKLSGYTQSELGVYDALKSLETLLRWQQINSTGYYGHVSTLR